MKKWEMANARLISDYHDKSGVWLSLGTVESATGGRIADKITNIPGSSNYFKGSLVTYSNDMKMQLSGVKEETLKLHGAVSLETAKEMAEGGRKLLHVDVCISTTGIAGPDGATPLKPLGLFYIGLASSSGATHHKYVFSGKREDIKEKASQAALQILNEYFRKRLDEVIDTPFEVKNVVTCFLEHRNMILILRRSHRVGTYQRSWAGVSGYIETDPLDQAYTEIREETGLFKSSVRLIKQGKPLEVVDRKLNRKWIVHPFLFHVSDPDKIKTDWEHTESKWIKPGDLSKYKTVPGLANALNIVLD
ncbi:MAG: nicotinamide-nucleotide amidohydrolase family protein [Dehalococcoidia bacterium]|jgi:nicotinamide-nucleotide amidase